MSKTALNCAIVFCVFLISAPAFAQGYYPYAYPEKGYKRTGNPDQYAKNCKSTVSNAELTTCINGIMQKSIKGEDVGDWQQAYQNCVNQFGAHPDQATVQAAADCNNAMYEETSKVKATPETDCHSTYYQQAGACHEQYRLSILALANRVCVGSLEDEGGGGGSMPGGASDCDLDTTAEDNQLRTCLQTAESAYAQCAYPAGQEGGEN